MAANGTGNVQILRYRDSWFAQLMHFLIVFLVRQQITLLLRYLSLSQRLAMLILEVLSPDLAPAHLLYKNPFSLLSYK